MPAHSILTPHTTTPPSHPKHTTQALRDYLTAGDKTRYDQLPDVRLSLYVCVHVLHVLYVSLGDRSILNHASIPTPALNPHTRLFKHNRHQGVVMVGVTHSNLTMSMPDIRLDLHTTVRICMRVCVYTWKDRWTHTRPRTIARIYKHNMRPTSPFFHPTTTRVHNAADRGRQREAVHPLRDQAPPSAPRPPPLLGGGGTYVNILYMCMYILRA